MILVIFISRIYVNKRSWCNYCRESQFRAIHCNGMNSQRVLVADSVVDTPEGHISRKVRKCTQPYVYTLGNND